LFTLRTIRRRNLNRNRQNLKTKEAKLAAEQKLGTEQNIMDMDMDSDDDDGSEYEDDGGLNYMRNFKDWRNFSVEMFLEWQENGDWDDTMDLLKRFYGERYLSRQIAVVTLPNTVLTEKGRQKLFTKMEAIRAFLNVLAQECSNVLETDNKVNVTSISERVTDGREYSAETVRYWCTDFLVSRLCRGIQYKRRPNTSIIHDEDARQVMNKWLKQATRNTPPCSASDFKDFIKARFGNEIGTVEASRWLRELGYNYRAASSLELYKDGANRPDVVRALDAY
jgi:transposase